MFGNKLGVHFQLTIFSASEISSRYKPITTGTCHTLLLVDHVKTFLKNIASSSVLYLYPVEASADPSCLEIALLCSRVPST